ncbi:MAG: flavodoxin domain-containing protein, partial [Bacteroidaceae bacterium]|nr:flavodoxin domain-containing protein [Bacteroidaceae bacterium]
MKTTGIIYGSTTGTTKSVAQVIATEFALPSGSVHDVADLTEDLIAKYDLLILGSSTWGYG